TALLLAAVLSKHVENGIETELKIGTSVEGSETQFSLALRDTATSSPVRGAHPAAWFTLPPKQDVNVTCSARIRELLAGSFLGAPVADLNSYYAVTLNDDATLSVVDPLFGFGGSKLLSLVPLKGRGEDWALSSDETRLFVTVPDPGVLAVIDTSIWKPLREIAVPHAQRVALQPDGYYAWVTSDDGVRVIDANSLEIAATLPKGHAIAFSDDGRYAFIAAEHIQIIDTHTLKPVASIETAATELAWSPSAKSLYALGKSTVTAIRDNKIIARIHVDATRIRFAPNGRFAVLTSRDKNTIHIFDASTNRIVQRGALDGNPNRIFFTEHLAYILRDTSEEVKMLPLEQLGDGHALSLADFPAGERAFARGAVPAIADPITQAPGENAVLVANPADKTIYYYREGMAAPMGSFQNYGRQPRAVLVVDRSLREKSAGTYATTMTLPPAGNYDVAVFVDAPRIVQCFSVTIDPRPDSEKPKRVHVERLPDERDGKSIHVRFRISEPATIPTIVFLAPGTWQQRGQLTRRDDGTYEIAFTPPQPGSYFVVLSEPRLDERQFVVRVE
ncbi:MAG TPA: hypothetical protein VMU84_20340, partial [Thermoanaerobaculia bacterium]|nr:hypothetical protein [Thermoanaerobaculia bacterium]